MTRRPAVFLDRDGVLNATVVNGGKPRPPVSIDDVTILPGVVDACRALRTAGFALVCVTNQPDVARGTIDAEDVARINTWLRDELRLDDVLVCPHDDADGCDCRKPQPGLLTRAARRLGLDLASSVMVGDRWRDIEAGRRAGCRTVLVDHAHGEQAADSPDLVVSSLLEAVPWIVRGGAAVPSLRVEIFADGPSADGVRALARLPFIKGFTTNPTTMRAAGVADYESFAREVLETVTVHPVSFEVFADDDAEMIRQALLIAGWGDNVFVKIPVTNTRGRRSTPVITALAEQGVRLNVTALLTVDQVSWVSELLANTRESFISVFAGRIADTGRDPVPIMRRSLEIMAPHPAQRLIWASTREVYNVVQADAIGCHVITLTPDLLTKLPLIGKDLDELSLETVRMFHRDAGAAGYRL